MIRYCDTSFLAPLIRIEATSPLLFPFVAAIEAGELAASQWTKLEMSSVFARDVRMGRISAADGRAFQARSNAMISSTFTVLVPDSADFERAERFVQRYETQLRAGDALHLAIAHNRSVDEIYSLDKGLLAAGKLLGLPVSTGLPLPGY